jgi:hypothetical protein
MPPAAYQRLDANPTIHMQMRFLGTKGSQSLRALRLKTDQQAKAMEARAKAIRKEQTSIRSVH